MTSRRARPDPSAAAIARRARHDRLVPPGSTCRSGCGATAFLKPQLDGTFLCYRCIRRQGGAPSFEDHHTGTKPVARKRTHRRELHAHRRATDIARDLGLDDWPAPNGDPLLTLAYVRAGEAIDEYIEAEYLRDLARSLRGQHGPTWHLGGPICPVVK